MTIADLADCVPFALAMLTGRGPGEINAALLAQDADCARVDADGTLGVRPEGARRALLALGYRVLRYQGTENGDMRPLRIWAARSATQFTGETLLVFMDDHAAVVRDGRVFDTLTPTGAPGAAHPEADEAVRCVYRVAGARDQQS